MSETLTGHYLPEQTYYAIGTQITDDVAAATDGRGADLVTTAGTYHEVLLDPASSFTHSQDMLEVKVASAHGAGQLAVPGKYTYDCSLEVVLRGLDVADANSRPNINAILGMFFDMSASNYLVGPPKTVVFFSMSHSHVPITVKKFTRGKGTDGKVTTYFGGLGSPTFKFEKNGVVKLSSPFVPLGHTGPVTLDDTTITVDGLEYKDTEGDFRLPVVHRNATHTLTQWISGGVVSVGHVIEGELSLNLSPERIEASGGLVNSGVKVIAGAESAGTGTLRVIQDSLTVFDPYALQAAAEPFAVSFLLSPVDGGSIVIACSAQISKITPSVEGTLAVWDIDLMIVHSNTPSVWDAGEIPREGRMQIAYLETV